jgi:hypothetical protein
VRSVNPTVTGKLSDIGIVEIDWGVLDLWDFICWDH